METIALVNLAVTLAIFLLVAAPYVWKRPSVPGSQQRLPRRQTTAPIKHPRIAGPTSSNVTRQIGYWREKKNASAEPFLAAWYERPETFSETDPIPADTYVDLTGRRINGVRFRSLYEPAEEVMEVRRFAPKAQGRTLVTPGGVQSAMSPEEEEKLAAEYELGRSPVDVNDPQVRAEIKKAMPKSDSEPPAA